MINKPFFSVIIPTYNRAEKIVRTIRSVLAQTFVDFELLVMDDGSTDNTGDVVESFGDPRIRYEWAKNSGGPATPRNRGIEAAQGEWLCFLDADDIWYPNKLEVVARAIERHREFEVFCHNEVLSVLATGYKSTLRYGPYEDDYYRVMLTNGNRVSTSATSARRDFLNRHGLRFNQSRDYVIVEDYDMWLRLALQGGRFYFIAEALGEYVIENDNLTANCAKQRHNQMVLLHDHVYKIQTFEPDKDKLWRQVRVRLTVQELREHIIQGRYGIAARILGNALVASPKGGVLYVLSWVQRRIRNVRKK